LRVSSASTQLADLVGAAGSTIVVSTDADGEHVHARTVWASGRSCDRNELTLVDENRGADDGLVRAATVRLRRTQGRAGEVNSSNRTYTGVCPHPNS
jgi:hypothetical protein